MAKACVPIAPSVALKHPKTPPFSTENPVQDQPSDFLPGGAYKREAWSASTL